MNKGRIAALGVAAVALMLLFGGCGGDGDTSSASISKEQYAKRANAICLDAKQRIQARFTQANRKIEASKEEISEGEQEERLVEVFAPPFEREIAELKELPPPSGDDQAAAELVEAMESALREVEENPSMLATSSGQFADINKVSSTHGLDDCVF